MHNMHVHGISTSRTDKDIFEGFYLFIQEGGKVDKCNL